MDILHPAAGSYLLGRCLLRSELGLLQTFGASKRMSAPENGIGTVVMSAKGQRRFCPNIRIAHAVPLVQPTCKKFRLGPIA